MLKSKTGSSVAVGAVAAALTVVTLVAPSGERSEETVAAAPDGAQGMESRGRGLRLHVVAFEEDHAFPGDVTAAIEQAGGEVVDVLDPLNIALVTSGHEDFLEQAMAASDAITAGARNHAIGSAQPDLPEASDILDDWLQELLSDEERRIGQENALGSGRSSSGAEAELSPGSEPLAAHQWGMRMVGATPDAAHRTATGRGVSVGIIDTGVDGSHPDIAPNFDRQRSRDFVLQDGSADIDPAGHGTHVAGIVGAANNGLGIAGVAPEVTLVNLRAGQDSGHFYVYEVVSALVAAGDLGLDVVNMSFYVDPWLYNCASRDDYVSGNVTDEQVAEQALVRQVMLDALQYAHDRGVTLVAAGGNEYLDMAAPERYDTRSPAYASAAGRARARTVTRNCLDLPAEGPNVVTVSSVGPSGDKADYANHGLGSIDLTAPGGWFGDHAGTPQFQQPGNLILSTFPLEAAQQRRLADRSGRPMDAFSMRDCNQAGCGFYTYLQGTSMSAPAVAGVAALVIQRHGRLHPHQVAAILTGTATDQPCPPGGVADYTAAGRPPAWNAVCVGTTSENSLHGHGIVNAARAIQ